MACCWRQDWTSKSSLRQRGGARCYCMALIIMYECVTLPRLGPDLTQQTVAAAARVTAAVVSPSATEMNDGMEMTSERSLVANRRRRLRSIVLATAGHVSLLTVSIPLASNPGTTCTPNTLKCLFNQKPTLACQHAILTCQ